MFDGAVLWTDNEQSWLAWSPNNAFEPFASVCDRALKLDRLKPKQCFQMAWCEVCFCNNGCVLAPLCNGEASFQMDFSCQLSVPITQPPILLLIFSWNQDAWLIRTMPTWPLHWLKPPNCSSIQTQDRSYTPTHQSSQLHPLPVETWSRLAR